MKYLEDKVREILNIESNAKYISALEVKQIGDMYILTLGLSNKDARPLSIGFQGSEEGFLKFLQQEFRKRRLHEVKWNRVDLINGEDPMFYPIIEL